VPGNPPGVAHDWHLNDRAYALRTVMSTAHVVRLFANNFQPDPSTVFSQFLEPTFTGYFPLQVGYAQIVQVQSGDFKLALAGFTVKNYDAAGQTVYGWFLTDSGPNVRFSLKWDAPLYVSGGSYFYFDVLLHEQAFSVVP